MDLHELLDNWGKSTIDYLPKIFLAIVVIVAFYITATLARKYTRKIYAADKRTPSTLTNVFSLLAYLFLLLSGIFIALEILGLESVLAKLLAGAGVMGIVAGFAFKDIASNAFAGLLLNMHKPFKTGDWVSIDDKFGTILDIGWITTSVKTVTGQEVFVPNQLIYNSTFTNYSTFQKRRVVLASGVSYGDDLDKVQAVALDEVQQIESVLKKEDVDFYFTEIGSSTYNFELRFWINFQHQKDFLTARSEIIRRIKRRFEEEDISLAYSVMSLDFGVKGGVNVFDQSLKAKMD